MRRGLGNKEEEEQDRDLWGSTHGCPLCQWPLWSNLHPDTLCQESDYLSPD